MIRAAQPRQDRLNLIAIQYHRQTLRRLDLLYVIQPGQLHGKHLTVQKQQNDFRLILSRSRHFAVDRQMRQKLLHLANTQVTRMTLAKIQTIAFNPLRIGLFGKSFKRILACCKNQPKSAVICRILKSPHVIPSLK